jgi:predicted dithiol-disulfide oxidoreductase (DUF899 family)
LSELFDDPSNPLVVYQYMYGGAQKRPCPNGTMSVDGFNVVSHYLRQNMTFAINSQAGIRELRRVGNGALLAFNDRRNKNPRLSPIWNLLDITPDGRGQWEPKLKY